MVDQGDACTNNFACLHIVILYRFIKHLFSGETGLCVGAEKEEEENYYEGASEVLASCLSYSETLCWSLNLSLQSLMSSQVAFLST